MLDGAMVVNETGHGKFVRFVEAGIGINVNHGSFFLICEISAAGALIWNFTPFSS